ncbi:MAG: hypothetical protein JWN30_2104 [Bacilli bacterium]|nr:hypothetical protein [Bacilli bacterium]
MEGEVITLLLLAVALGMDAFSLGIGLGMQGLTKKEIIRVSFTIAVFHMVMPLTGMYLGIFFHRYVGELAKIVGAVLLIILGLQMIWNAWRVNDSTPKLDRTAGFGLLLFAASVSIDAFSVGLSLGLFEAPIGLVLAMFGVIGGLMAAIGLLIGNRVSSLLGEYGEAVGGLILLVFGLKFLF